MSPFDIRDDALVLRVVAALAAVSVPVAHVHQARHSLEQHLLGGRRQPAPWNRGRETSALGERIDQSAEIVRNVRGRPGGDRSFGETLVRIGDHQLGVDFHPRSQARTCRACSPRTVERELAGLQLVNRDVVVVGTRHLLGVVALPLWILRVEVHEVDRDDTLRQLERRLHRIGQPKLDRRLHREPVHDDVDGVLVLLVKGGRIGELDDLRRPEPG